MPAEPVNVADAPPSEIPHAAVSGDEHPSGLRDAIERGIREHECPPWNEVRVGLVNYIESEVVAWLSVVSEEEIGAAARALLCAQQSYAGAWETASQPAQVFARFQAGAALAASRGVLLPKETR